MGNVFRKPSTTTTKTIVYPSQEGVIQVGRQYITSEPISGTSDDPPPAYVNGTIMYNKPVPIMTLIQENAYKAHPDRESEKLRDLILAHLADPNGIKSGKLHFIPLWGNGPAMTTLIEDMEKLSPPITIKFSYGLSRVNYLHVRNNSNNLTIMLSNSGDPPQY